MELIHVLDELKDMETRGMLNNAGEVVFGLTNIAPGKLTLQGIGAQVYNFARLGTYSGGKVEAETIKLLT